MNDSVNGNFQAVAANFSQGQVAEDYPSTAAASTASFTLTDVTPVPLPAGLPLLASGLAGMGLFGVRRRRSAR